MTLSERVVSTSRLIAKNTLSLTRDDFRIPRELNLVAAAALGIGVYFNWSWLVGAGLGPLIVGLAPCVAMCVIGLCMVGRTGKPADEVSRRPDSTEQKSAGDAARLKSATSADAEGKPNCHGS